MNRKSLIISLVLSCVLILGSSTVYAGPPAAAPSVSSLASGLGITLGSTVGPDGALYVPNAAGEIWRVDPQTGDKSIFASGLPQAIFPIGGPMDVAFIGETAYALVSIVGSDIGGNDIVGIYRVDSPSDFTVVADLGQWSIDNPSGSDVFIPSGVFYALEIFRGGFLVTDGHHNRVLWATRDGEVNEMRAFDDNVPTGLAVRGDTIYMAEAGEVPHYPEDGKVMAFGPKSDAATELAAGAPLLVDVEFGRGHTLYALAQGYWSGMFGGDGSPADPYTGSLVQVKGDGTFDSIVEELNQPTSLEFIGNTAYVITFGGEILKIDDVSGPPFGTWR